MSDQEQTVQETALAKINLDLLVMHRRADGYHELDSLVVFAGIGDRLAFEPADGWEFEADGPFAADLPRSGDNIVLRAARLLEQAARRAFPARIRLDKQLPVASGIGGGSADAAATLRGLKRLWHLDMDDEQLRDLALELGADLPVCVYSRAARMRGIGERLDPVRGLPELPLVLVNPGCGVATAAVFAKLELDDARSERQRMPAGPSVTQLGIWLGQSRNDLEAPALAVEPRIATVLEALRAQPDVILARMSGSGATCFALFQTMAMAERAAAAIGSAQPGWWVQAVRAEAGR